MKDKKPPSSKLIVVRGKVSRPAVSAEKNEAPHTIYEQVTKMNMEEAQELKSRAQTLAQQKGLDFDLAFNVVDHKLPPEEARRRQREKDNLKVKLKIATNPTDGLTWATKKKHRH